MEKKSHSPGSVIFIAAFAFTLAGCSRYQYLFVDSPLPVNNIHEYAVDNDTVSLRYNFGRSGLAATVSVENKLRQPLYIDYSRSVIVVNNEQLKSPLFLDDQPGFIAPLSKVTIRNVAVRYSYFSIPDSMLAEKVRIGSSPGFRFSFPYEYTPLHFRHILAISPNEDYSNPTFHDYSFWISDIIESRARPKSIDNKPANQSYLMRSETVQGLTFTAIITVSALAFTVLMAALFGG